MKWGFIRRFPKIALVAGVLIISNGLFFIWWTTRAHSRMGKSAVSEGVKPSDTALQTAVAIDFSKGGYFMAGDDLYDAVAGKLVAKNFLNGANPNRLLYEPESKKLIGMFQNGYIQYGLDGHEEAKLLKQYKIAYVPDSKKIVFAQDGDIWTAEVDLKEFKLVNERKATSAGFFDEVNFADNLYLLTEKFALLRNKGDEVRVDLETGQVKSGSSELRRISKLHSPDSKTIVTIFQNQLVVYNFESDQATTRSLGRTHLTDEVWLDNDRVLLLINNATMTIYDRRTDKLDEIYSLPPRTMGRQVLQRSPDGRYVFLIAVGGGGLVDVPNKSVIPLDGDAQGYYWVGNDSLLMSRNTQDTDRRGTWLKELGGTETRVTTDPFLVMNGLPLVLPSKDLGVVIFQTEKGLRKATVAGGNLQNISAPLPLARLVPIETQVSK